MGKKMTNEEFIFKLEAKRNDVIALGEYVDSNTKILFKCKKCGNEWLAKPTNILFGKGCPNCSRKKSHDVFIKEVFNINPHIEVIDRYIKDNTKILFKCKKCGNEWYQTPNNILNNKCGCPICVANRTNSKNTLTHNEFCERMFVINPNIKFLDEYKKSYLDIRCKCEKCGNEWINQPRYLLLGSGCPICNKSKLEKKVENFLEENNVIFERQKRFNWLNKQSLDFYLPDYNVAIECQGEQHFRPVKFFGGINRYIDTINRDLKKKMVCNENVEIIYVFDKKYKNYVNNNEILKEIYNNAKILFSDDLYCFWKEKK